MDMEQSLRIKLLENKSEIKAVIEAEREKQKEILTQELKRQSNLIFDKKNITKILYVNWCTPNFIICWILIFFICLAKCTIYYNPKHDCLKKQLRITTIGDKTYLQISEFMCMFIQIYTH